MIKSVRIIGSGPTSVLISSASIIVTRISLSSGSTSISPLILDVFEADGVTPICKLRCRGLFEEDASFGLHHPDASVNTTFLAPRGVHMTLSAPNGITGARAVIHFMNDGA